MNNKIRLDQRLLEEGLVSTRSQAASYIKLGKVTVRDKTIKNPGQLIGKDARIKLTAARQYVSRAGLKLDSAASKLNLNFNGKIVLDVGSSTGGFTDYSLRHGAAKVISVDIGSDQLHSSLRFNPKVQLHEKTDILNVAVQEDNFVTRRLKKSKNPATNNQNIVFIAQPDIILVDVSFVSLKQLLPHISSIMLSDTRLIIMAKPQFEARGADDMHQGVIKNNKIRRLILADLETWLKSRFIITGKADSEISGGRGNVERFYSLRKIVKSK